MLTVMRVNQLAKEFGLKPTSPQLIQENKGPIFQHLATVLSITGDDVKILMGALVIALVKSRQRSFYINDEMVQFLIKTAEPVKKIEYSTELLIKFLVQINKIPAFKLINRTEGKFKIVSENLLREIREQEGH